MRPCVMSERVALTPKPLYSLATPLFDIRRKMLMLDSGGRPASASLCTRVLTCKLAGCPQHLTQR